MNYYYLKIGKGNHLAADYLAGKNQLGCPAAVVFFDNLSQEDYRGGKGEKEAAEYISRASASLRDETQMVVVHAGEVWLLRPAGDVVFLPSQVSEEGHTLTPKLMPVELIVRRWCKDVPSVLAGIAANQYFARGTFRLIKDWGNLKAIDCLTGRIGAGEHWDPARNGPNELLVCLSSTELETLVARTLEGHGCFVPAHHGGVMKDIDLFAHNDSTKPIVFGTLVIPPGQRASLQVKRWAPGLRCAAHVDCLIGPGVTGPKTINGEQLIELVRAVPMVARWLERSLHWLPNDWLGQFQLRS